MKTLLKSKNIPVLVLILGGVGCALRWLLYATAVDEKNLIPLGHPLAIALWLVAAAALVLTVMAVKGMNEEELQENPLGNLGFLGCISLAVGMALTVMADGFSLSGLEMIRDVLGLLGAAAMVVAAVQKKQGHPTFFLLSAVVCVFFAVHMVSCYRGWSSNPQLQDYVFTLFSCISLMLFAYQHAACAADCGSPRLLLAFGLLSVFSCLVCLSGTADTLLYAAGGIWAATNLAAPALPLPAETDEGE